MKNKNLFDSFQHAADGVLAVIKQERNMKIHLTAAVFVVILSLFVEVSPIEYMILSMTVFFVFASELFNTAIEAAVDIGTKGERQPLAKLAKDGAAAGVLMAALNALVVGYFIFFEKLIALDTAAMTLRVLKFRPAYTLAACGITIITLTLFLKYVTKAENLLKGGMPSAHGAVSFCLATCIFFFTNNTIAIVLGYFLAALVAQSRVEGKIHTGLQVVLGALLGLFGTTVVFQIIYRL